VTSVNNTNANTFVPNGNNCAIFRPNGSSVLQLRFSAALPGFSFVGRNWAAQNQSVNMTLTLVGGGSTTTTIGAGSAGNVLFVGWLSSTSLATAVTFTTTSGAVQGQMSIDDLQVACAGNLRSRFTQ
jgi:hypothetical protein